MACHALPVLLAAWALAAAAAGRTAMKLDPDLGISESLAHERAARVSNLRYDLAFTIPAVRIAADRRARADPLRAGDGRRAAGARLPARPRRDPAARRGERRRDRDPPGERPRHRPGRRRCAPARTAWSWTSTPATRRSIAATISSTRSSCRRGRTWRFPASISRTSRRAGRWRSTCPTGWQVLGNGAELERGPRRRPDARPLRRRRSRSPPISSRSPRASSTSSRRSGTAGRSGCSIARPTPRRSRATATRSSISTPRRSTGSRTTRRSRIRSASSISCSCRRSSSAAWSIPARSSTTPAGCCSTRARRRTRCSAAPASSRTRPRTCGSAISSRCSGSSDVWMKEVFANHMAAKIVNPAFPAVNHDLRYPARLLPAGLRRRSHRRHQRDPPAAQEPRTRRARSTARSFIRRRRSSCASSRRWSGRDGFRDGLREYLKSPRLRATRPGPI